MCSPRTFLGYTLHPQCHPPHQLCRGARAPVSNEDYRLCPAKQWGTGHPRVSRGPPWHPASTAGAKPMRSFGLRVQFQHCCTKEAEAQVLPRGPQKRGAVSRGGASCPGESRGASTVSVRALGQRGLTLRLFYKVLWEKQKQRELYGGNPELKSYLCVQTLGWAWLSGKTPWQQRRKMKLFFSSHTPSLGP